MFEMGFNYYYDFILTVILIVFQEVQVKIRYLAIVSSKYLRTSRNSSIPTYKLYFISYILMLLKTCEIRVKPYFQFILLPLRQHFLPIMRLPWEDKEVFPTLKIPSF